MTNMQQIVEEIKKTKAIAEEKLEQDATYRVKYGRQVQAKERLRELWFEYRKEVLENSVFILVAGDKSEKFANVATKEFQCYGVNAEDLYKDLLRQIPSKVYMNQIGSRSFFEHIQGRLGERARELEIVSMKPVIFNQKYKKMVESEDDALSMLKQAINDQVGAELAALDAIDKVAFESVNSEINGKVVPIVLYSTDESLVKDIARDLKHLPSHSALVIAGKTEDSDLTALSINDTKTVSKTNVEKTLVKVRESLN